MEPPGCSHPFVDPIGSPLFASGSRVRNKCQSVRADPLKFCLQPKPRAPKPGRTPESVFGCSKAAAWQLPVSCLSAGSGQQQPSNPAASPQQADSKRPATTRRARVTQRPPYLERRRPRRRHRIRTSTEKKQAESPGSACDMPTTRPVVFRRINAYQAIPSASTLKSAFDWQMVEALRRFCRLTRQTRSPCYPS